MGDEQQPTMDEKQRNMRAWSQGVWSVNCRLRLTVNRLRSAALSLFHIGCKFATIAHVAAENCEKDYKFGGVGNE